MESRCCLVVVRRLLDVIALHLGRWDIAVIEANALVGTLIEDMIVVDKLQRFYAGRVAEVLISVEAILVGTDTATCRSPHDKLEHICEQVHLRANRLHGIVESGIGVLRKVELTVNVPSPDNILRHLRLRGECYLCTRRHGIGIRLLGSLLLLCPALWCLCRDSLHHEHHDKNG